MTKLINPCKEMNPMKPTIYITRLILDEALSLITQSCEVRMRDNEDTTVPREILEKEITEVDGVYIAFLQIPSTKL